MQKPKLDRPTISDRRFGGMGDQKPEEEVDCCSQTIQAVPPRSRQLDTLSVISDLQMGLGAGGFV